MSTKTKPVLKQQPKRVPRVRLDSIKNPQPRPAPQAARQATPPPSQRNVVPFCTNASCDESDVASENGQLLCRNCGTVIRDEQITSEVTFGETSTGAAVLQGSYVGADQSYSRLNAPGGSKITGGMDSREVTEANGRRLVKTYTDALQLGESFIDDAMQAFKLAIGHNFIQGRHTTHVAAVCLYIACRRRDDNRIMLIDLSDILRINVFKLGQIYSALVDLLGLRRDRKIEPINAESLIYRFAQKLEFGDATYRVAKEAVQILRRMDRDWMMVGRRPAGVCGAALIIAARMNNFRRTVREVVYVVKVTDMTIEKRLEEFKYTESSKLTVAEFRNHGDRLETECDPPAFYAQFLEKKKRRKRVETGTAADEQTSESEQDDETSATSPETSRRGSTATNAQHAQADSQAMPPPPIPIDPALVAMSGQRLSEIQGPEALEPAATVGNRGLKRKRGGKSRNPGKPSPDQPEPQLDGPPGRKKRSVLVPSSSQIEDESAIESEISSVLADPELLANANVAHNTFDAVDPNSPPPTQGQGDIVTPGVAEAKSAASMPPPNQENILPGTPPATQENHAAVTISNDDLRIVESTESPVVHGTQQSETETASSRLSRIPSTAIIPEDEFAGDQEIDDCLLTPEEVEIKERIWVHENADYLRAQQAKMIKQQLAEEMGTARPIVHRKRRRGRMGDMSTYQKTNEDGQSSGPQTPAEATAAMLAHRGYSTKINYAAVHNLYNSSSSSRSGSVALSELGSRATTPAETATSPNALQPATPLIVAPTHAADNVDTVDTEEPNELKDLADEAMGDGYDDDLYQDEYNGEDL